MVFGVLKVKQKFNSPRVNLTFYSSHEHKCVVVVWQCQIFTISHTMEAGRAEAKWRPCQSSVSHNATANICKHWNLVSSAVTFFSSTQSKRNRLRTRCDSTVFCKKKKKSSVQQ